MSSEWVKCTSPNGGEIQVNLANAAYIRIVEGETRIVFPGAADEYLRVRETPDEIMSLRKMASG
jgi:hypothetical protein